MAITSAQYEANIQQIRNLRVKINLLINSYSQNGYIVVDSLEGNAIDGSINIDANADIRRSCKIELVVTDSSFDVQSGGKIFLDKFIQIYVGIDNLHTSGTTWYNQGIYLINQPSYQYDAVTNTLSFDGVDLMSKLTGLRNGYLLSKQNSMGGIDGYYLIPQGSNIRSAMIAALQLGGFNNFIISNNLYTLTTPADLEFTQGSTIYDMISKLRDIEPEHQVYFDVNGVFHYDLIPSGATSPVVIDDSTWVPNVLSEQINVDFESVKNYIEIYGATHTVNYTPTSSTVSGANINLVIDGLTSLSSYTMIGFTPSAPILGSTNITIQINSGTAHNLLSYSGSNLTRLDPYYTVIVYVNGNWIYYGGLQSSAKAWDSNPESPFYTTYTESSSTGLYNPTVIGIALSGGDYENIQSSYLAQQRANYELYVRCRLNDTVQLSTIPIYYLDVHQLASYTPNANNSAGTTYQYMIQSISFGLTPEATMSITMSKFYPAYPILSN